MREKTPLAKALAKVSVKAMAKALAMAMAKEMGMAKAAHNNIGCPKKSYSIKVKQKVHRKKKMT